MLSAWRPQRPTRQDCGPLLSEVPCPACYYSKEEASWKCYDHRHGGSSLALLRLMPRFDCADHFHQIIGLSKGPANALP